MVKNIKVIVCDIDSTLLAPGQERLSPRLRKDFQQAIEQGIHVMINTGRHYTFLQKSLFEDLPMEYIGTINGACLTDREGKTLYKYPMSEEEMWRLTSLAREYGGGLGFKFEDAVVTYANHEVFLDGYCHDNQYERSLVIDGTKDKSHHLKAGLPLGTFLICPDEVAEKIAPQMPEMTFSWSHRHGYDVFLSSINKALSVEPVLRKLQCGWENVIAFGDAGNDTPFIRRAGIGVAMGNAKDDVLSAADYIAPRCEEDGVARTLEDLGIV